MEGDGAHQHIVDNAAINTTGNNAANNIMNAGNSSSNSLFFTKLRKFNGDITEDLNTWIREFERCCLIANKTDDLIKGQYLMLCVGGRAKAVLDDLEAEVGTAQTFTVLTEKLKTTFDSTSARESKMTMFEDRRQKLEETEEEFMLALLRLYKNANPNADAANLNSALKRKFLQGISPALKRNVFIFCNDPYRNEVSREQLLLASRNARDLLDNSSDSSSPVCSVIPTSDRNDEFLDSIKKLSLQIGSHRTQNSDSPGYQHGNVAALTSTFRGGYRGRYAGNRRNNQQWRGRGYRPQDPGKYGTPSSGSYSKPNSAPIICFKCGGENHLARHCMSKVNRPLNE